MDMKLLRRGDRGAEVAYAQDLLNRGGALLEPDGDFGPATARAVREFRLSTGLDAAELIDPEVWARLNDLPEPSPDIPTRAVTFIAREEVGSRELYDRQAMRPTWPGGASGVTIGVGYDLGYQSNFAADWGDLLTRTETGALMPWVGITGPAAQAAIPRLSWIVLAWDAAWHAYTRRTLPEQVALTRRTFIPPADRPLPPLCFGVLVSLIYNRGASMTDAPGSNRRAEMRGVRDSIAQGQYEEVPTFLLSMRRLWPRGSGLIGRREREAALFTAGLAGFTPGD